MRRTLFKRDGVRAVRDGRRGGNEYALHRPSWRHRRPRSGGFCPDDRLGPGRELRRTGCRPPDVVGRAQLQHVALRLHDRVRRDHHRHADRRWHVHFHVDDLLHPVQHEQSELRVRAPANGSATLVDGTNAANTITKDESGQLCASSFGSGGSYSFIGSYTITGGTGVYSGATGSGTVSTFQPTQASPFTSSENGTIDTASEKPGKGCGDKNHVHQRQDECK